MGILDLLIGQGGMLGQRQQQPQYDWMPQQQPTGLAGFLGDLGNKKYQMAGYLSGALMPGTTQEQIARGLAGMTQGALTDVQFQMRNDQLKNQREQRGAAAGVIDPTNLTPAQKRFFATNPEAWKEYSKALVSPQTTTIGQTVLQQRPFGGVTPQYVEPYKPELVEGYDPQSGRSFKAPFQLPQPHGFAGMAGQPQQAPQVAPGGAPGTPAPGAGLQPPGVAGGFYSAPSPQEKEEGQKVGQGLGEDYTKIQKDAAAATKSRGTYQRMLQLNNDPRMWQGAAAPAVTQVKSLLASFNIDPKSVAPGEEFVALANRAVLDSMNGSLGPGVSNNDVRFMANSLPNLAHTAEGRRQLIETLSAVSQRQIDVARMATQYRKQNGTLDGFTTFVAQWADQNPLFKDRETAAPSAPPPAAAIEYLKKNPNLRDAFEQKFGRGSAAQYLAQ